MLTDTETTSAEDRGLRDECSRLWNQDGVLCKLLLLVAGVCTFAALVYWRQRPHHSMNRPTSYDLMPNVTDILRKSLNSHPSSGEIESHWTWICRNDRCERLAASTSTKLQSLQTCNMLCASTQLWPQPTGPVSLATAAVPVRADRISLQVTTSPSRDVTEHLNDAFALMKEDIRSLEKAPFGRKPDPKRRDIGTPRDILIRVAVNGSSDVRLLLDTDESYRLSLKPNDSTLVADISAHSFCGARHGIETLTQLIWFDPYASSLLALEAASVEDAPRFHYRGLLLDTARHYCPVYEIMGIIDAMAACKMNTFHWLASHSQSFTLKLNSVPQMAQYGAKSPDAIYSSEDIRTIVRRARLRGIRVLIEINAPTQVGRAWAWGPEAGLGHLAYCFALSPSSLFDEQHSASGGQLNPRNPNVYDLLQRIYAEIIELTGVDDIFHIGGNEISERCWTQHFNDTNPMDLWVNFTRRAMLALERANGGKVPELTLLWSSRLTRSPYLERLDRKQIGIQVWGGSWWPESRAVLDAGFRSVISHVEQRFRSNLHSWPYRPWQKVYDDQPWAPTLKKFERRVEGGEICQVEPLNAHEWVSTAALAERLWTDRAKGPSDELQMRMDTQLSRLVARGVQADPVFWLLFSKGLRI